MRGIILAGGNGTRLYPMTTSVSKQLLPIFDKPMIYYALSTLLLAGIREIAVITRPSDQNLFQDLLGDGSGFGVELTFIPQNKANGLPEAYLLAEDFLDSASSMMVLGDNLFHGSGLGRALRDVSNHERGARVFLMRVSDPTQYGVWEEDQGVVKLVEKPKNPESDLAISGLYVLDSSAPERARSLKPSSRGEIEMVDLLESYLRDGELASSELVRGSVWLDSGTPKGLAEASEFVRVMQERQGRMISCPEEISLSNGWITTEELSRRIKTLPNSNYRNYLENLIK
jgi:glucose-1-phosphate thymidylyltransferase